MTLSFTVLKKRQREIRDDFPEGLGLRTHRALSWLQRAEKEGDLDSKFIFLWIAFNAAYAYEFHEHAAYSEKRKFVQFFNKLITFDNENILYSLVWNEFPSSIRSLLDNKYIFQPFWEFQKGRITEDEWKIQFKQSKQSANKALGKMNTKKGLLVIFDRLYVLRNQLVHGGATWNSQVNRNQIREGASLLGKLVPIIIHIMMENYKSIWGEPSYPVIIK